MGLISRIRRSVQVAGWEGHPDDTCTLPAEWLKVALEKYLYKQCGFNMDINTDGHYVMFALCRETLSTY